MNRIFGVVFHWLCGLASGSFYVPYKGVKKWSRETYWLVGGIFSWIICPLLLANILTKNVFGVLGSQSATTLGPTYVCGVFCVFGGLTFGLAMRYLGAATCWIWAASCWGGRNQSYTGAGDQLRPLQRAGKPHKDDWRLAGILLSVSGP